ncbi:helix-turn-helix domain-containing protein [Spirosoma utsteinense]|uniref:AraC-like DNA-binding protein n=1 Tax=Spirosoma utsteinense TaxID=2585773 RepID=A0ABR6WDB7_9BACT|nr:AraC family transcriptional regulator [Spirosoma utsteinense]MBC3784223.1 AraC-like DNA-binding protein [Spirosoma utsteinense]MBC3793990.1 AraC-like DNA-binding protein [Spirosoma utsteinense]
MQPTESLEAFYRHKFNTLPDTPPANTGQVNVFRLEDCLAPTTAPVPYSRRDFYKITLIRGRNLYHYADKSIEIDGPTLVFFNPQVPYTWQAVSGDTTGFFCIFREAFFRGAFDVGLTDLPLFQPGGKPAYTLNTDEDAQVSALFEKMLAEINSDYALKYDLLRNYVSELIHYALKRRPSDVLHQHPDARSRLTAIFLELLERQFPIESPARRFTLRSASDFARQLAVHVNHLNRCVRDTTGKTTTDHIADRLAGEARALLRHSDWNVAEVGYSLGFDEPTHFNYFFRKHTGLTPSAFRRV